MGSRRYVGKYVPKRRRRLPLASVILIMMAVLAMSIGGVAAYLSTTTGAVRNSFAAASEPVLMVKEDPFTQETSTSKTNVKVSVNDLGDFGYAVFVRAVIVATWEDSQGNVLALQPQAGIDYSITINETDWFLVDNYYYHTESVLSGSESKNLITECKVIKEAPVDGYTLNINIIAQTIQALGTTDGVKIPAVEDAWQVVTIAKDEEGTPILQNDNLTLQKVT